VKSSAFIDKAFPVPRALQLADTAIDLSDGLFRSFEFSRSRGALAPKAWSASPFPRTRHGGMDEKARAEAAAALKSKAAALGIKSVKALIHEGDVFVFKTRAPIQGDLRLAVEASLEENVPIPPAEVVFEYELVYEDDKRGQRVAAVFAVPVAAVSEHADIIKLAGLSLAGFETEGRAIARALVAPGDEGTHAILTILEKHSVVSVVLRGVVCFSSSVDVGAADLDVAVAKTFNIKPEEARALRRSPDAASNTKGGRSSQNPQNAPSETALFEAMIPVFATIRDELSKVLVYARGQAKKEGEEAGVSDIILAGSDALVPGFARYISLTSHLPARVGSVWTNVLDVDRYLPAIDRQASLDQAVLIGALL
jgi:Tfp pilus assembly PilM family ATPase